MANFVHSIPLLSHPMLGVYNEMVKLKNMYRTNKQSGVASIFIVVFFTLLISIIVISFVTIVNQDQRQALNNDLYSSAYDSAQAGVEDAKRALELYRKDCIVNQAGDCNAKYTDVTTGALSGASCSIFQEKLSGDLGLDVDGSEVRVATKDSSNDRELDQAYSCLSVKLQTDDYQRTLQNGNTVLLPLKTVSGQPNSVLLHWFDKQNAQNATVPSATSNFDLPSSGGWNSNTPPIIRVQAIALPDSNIDMSAVDQGSKTLFLYPSSNGANSISFSLYDGGRGQPKGSPIAAKCDGASTAYACNIELTDLPVTGNNYYLRITSIYNDANIQVKLKDGSGAQLKFDGVNPEIDSTGRANDVFRRVISRIAFDTDKNGIDITQGICKNFTLADSYSDTTSPGNPTKDFYHADCGVGKDNLVNE